MTSIEKQVFEEALAKWPNTQPLQYIEEAAELMVADSHERRGRATSMQTIMEIADLRFALKQLIVCIAHRNGASIDYIDTLCENKEALNLLKLQQRLKDKVAK
jgi:phosphoribosyl-ATP pyrophosphohydrolase